MTFARRHATLDREQAVAIKAMLKQITDEHGKREYGAIPQIAKELGVKPDQVRSIADGRTWRHVS